MNKLFQFTPLREGRQKYCYELQYGDEFQFTPLREGRRICRKTAGAGWTISIHAPPRGATQYGGTRIPGENDFNSRPSARGDRNAPVQTA